MLLPSITLEQHYFYRGLSCGVFKVARYLTQEQALGLMGYPGSTDMLTSARFVLQSVPIKSLVQPFPRIHPVSNSFGPIIVDHTPSAGMTVIADGRHRYWDAVDAGQTHIMAWVGDKAVIEPKP